MKKALLTIGNTFRGDDGAGYALGQRIESRGGWTVFQGEDCPENQIHLIRKFAPDLILVADAVLGIEEGEAHFIDVSQEKIKSFMTHNIPVQYLIQFLEDFCDKVVFLGMGVSEKKILNIECGLSDKALSAVVNAEELIFRFEEMLS